MSKFTTKVASIALTVTTVVSLSGLGSIASAQTTDLATLLAQLQQLQAQIAALQGNTGGGSACAFTRDLTVGSRGTDVECLQRALVAKGFLVMPAGVAFGYFGSLTQAAVSKWQASAGVSPTAGYFGPRSRAAFGSVTVPGLPTGPINTTTSLWVAAGVGSPTGSAIAGAGQINVGRFSFTAPTSMGATITGMTFQKVGVLSDSNINNLYFADASTGEVVAQFQSLTNGIATFGGLAINVAAGATWWGELRADISTSATSGNTLAFDLTGVTTAGTMQVGGLPVKGNVLTVTSVSNPSIAAMTLTANAVGSTVDAGTNSVLVSSWTANVTNSKVKLTNMQFTFVGSANPADIRNIRLMVNGAQVATLAQASTNTNFNFSGIELNTGNSTIEIFADVAGSPQRTFDFTLLQPYRVTAIDTQYNAGITVTITDSTSNITINTGSITVQVASDTPTQPIPAGASGVALAKFTVYAAGEPVKVKFLDVTFTKTSGSAWGTGNAANITDDLSNIRVLGNDGGQVGNNISTVAEGTTSGTCTLTSSTAMSCHFGTSSSPINYIVAANTTRVLTVYADIGSATDITTLAVSLPTMTSNLEGQVSFQSASSGTASAATRQVTLTPLSVAANTGFTTPTYIAGAVNAKIASFTITAASAQGARITSLTFDKDSNASFDMQSMKIMVDGVQFGVTRPTIGDSETSLAFSAASPITIAAGSSKNIDVYADILSTTTAVSHAAVVDITGWSAMGTISNSAITFPGAASGQDITISSGPTLTLALGSTASVKHVVMGSTNVDLFTFRMTANNVDDVRITDIIIDDTIANGSSTSASFQNFTLWDGSTKVAGPINAAITSAASTTVTFSLNPVVVAKNGSKDLKVRADVASFNDGAISNSTHIFKVNANGNITAQAVGSSSATVTVSGAPQSGNTQSVFRTKLTVAGSNTTGSGRTRQTSDDIGTLTFTADAAYQAKVQSVVILFAGAAVSVGTSVQAQLIDTGTGTNLTDDTNTSTGTASCTTGAGNTCAVTFNVNRTLSGGESKTVTVRINSASFFNSSTAGEESLSAEISAASSVTFYDGTTSSISIEATAIPVRIAAISYN